MIYCNIHKGDITLRKKTNKEFLKEVSNLTKNEYTFLEPYKGSPIKIKVRHNACGHEYMVSPNMFISHGNRCPYCNGNKAKQKNTSIFKKEVFAQVGNEYTVLGEYKTNSTNILIRHNVCGRKYMVRPNNFLHGSRCVTCEWDSRRLTRLQVVNYIREALGDTYMLVGDYISMQHKIEIKHFTCGYIFKVRLTDVVQKKSGCPRCSQSSGENLIMAYLQNHDIEFQTQKRFKGLKGKKFPLSYDFYLPSKKILIEYQGEQHFIPKAFGGVNAKTKNNPIDNFNSQRIHDKKKYDFAIAHGYMLLRPNYKIDTYSKMIDYLDTNLPC